MLSKIYLKNVNFGVDPTPSPFGKSLHFDFFWKAFLTMVKTGAKLHIPWIKGGLVLFKMAVMTSRMWRLSSKMTRPKRSTNTNTNIIGNIHQHKKRNSYEGWKGEDKLASGCTGCFFLTGPPLNFRSTGSHANWPGIYLSVSSHKGISYLENLGGVQLKKTTL